MLGESAVFSLIVPVFRNEGSIPALVETLKELNRKMAGDLEAVFVVDGSPDKSAELLASALPKAEFLSQLIVLSRNFGVFPAITAGLASAQGSLFATMAADLQEPPELILVIREKLQSGDYDVVVAMYHDQGLAPLKMVAFEQGVNWTLGLPFVRTSPDHGTAYDIAGKGIANPSSMLAALRLAKQLARSHPQSVS